MVEKDLKKKEEKDGEVELKEGMTGMGNNEITIDGSM